MDKSKTISRKAKGGLLASAITLLVALLALGVGTAFGAEGGLAALLKQVVGDATAPVVNAAGNAKGGGMLRAESLSGTAYAVLDTDTGTLTFIRSNNTVGSGTNTTITDIKGVDHAGIVFRAEYPNGDVPPWLDVGDQIQSIDSDAEQQISFTNVQAMFANCTSLTTADFSGFDTSSATNMMDVFHDCSSLSSIDLSGWDTSAATNTAYMFAGCSSLTSVSGLSGWDTGSVTDMNGMFSNCGSLASLDLSGWDTGSATSMNAMFSDCSSLASLDLSGWDTDNVTNMSVMFFNCSFLTSVSGLSGWDTGSVTDMRSMFSGCSYLASLDLSGWDIGSVTDMADMFDWCPSLTSLNLSGWDTGSVTDMSMMFAGCSSLTSVGDLSGWDTGSVTDMTGMFLNCSSLTSLDLSGWDTGSVTDMNGMFSGCSSLASLDLSGFSVGSERTDLILVSNSSLVSITFGPHFDSTNFSSPYDGDPGPSYYPYTGNWIQTIDSSGQSVLPENAEVVSWTALALKSGAEKHGTWVKQMADAVTHTVTFVSNGGSAVPQRIVADGDSVECPWPSRDGYDFAGWYLDEQLTDAYSGDPIYSDTTLYASWSASWSPSSYQVVFLDAVGNWFDCQDCNLNGLEYAVCPAENPTVEGAVFDGWYLDYQVYSMPFDFNEPVTSSQWLYPKFIDPDTGDVVEAASVQFYVNIDGCWMDYATQTMVAGNLPNRPTDPVYEGYTFAGWYVDYDGEIPYDFTEPIYGYTQVYGLFTEGSQGGGDTPTPVVPDTTVVTVERNDDTEGADPIPMTLTEVLPSGMTTDGVDTSGLTMTVQEPVQEYEPEADSGANSLVYNFTMGNRQRMSVPLVRGSSVTLANTSQSLDVQQGDGSDSSQSGQFLVIGTVSDAQPLSIAFGASPKAAPTPNPTPSGDRPQGWIRVNRNADVNTAVSYEAFKLFDAAVSYDGTDYKGTHIDWADNATKSAVMGFLRDAGNAGAYSAWLATKYGRDANSITAGEQELAQNAAEYIAAQITASGTDATAATDPRTTLGDSFANRLANVLRNASGVTPIAVPANQITTVDQGYYLVATDPATIDGGEAGTASVWAPVPQGGYTVTEKVSVPVFTKKVRDNTDETEEYGKIADASTNQWLDFRLTTTLPANIRAFPAYPIQIVDVIPDTMTGTLDGLTVSLDGTPLDSGLYTATLNSPLTITIGDVLTLDGVDGGSEITVDYKAKLNANATRGSDGNLGTATLTYAADTMTEGTAQLTSTATVLTYELRVDKVDETTRLNVDGAQFNAKTTIGNTEYWVAQDGTPTLDANQKGTWTTGATTSGTLTIGGIDEGTYVLYEMQAPTLYEPIAQPLTVIIDAQKDYDNGTLEALGIAANGLSGANGNLYSPASATQDGFVGSDTSTGTVHVRISDVKQIVLPLTGMPVKTLGIIVGIGLTIASVVAFVVNKRKAQNEEDVEE